MRHRHITAITAALALALCWAAGPPTATAADATGTSYTWVGSSQDTAADNHSWTDSRNWSPGGVPGNGDSVSIIAPNATHCTAHVDNVPTVSLVNFSLAENPTLCSDSVHGAPITVTGSFTWNGGNLDTPTTIAAGATGTVSGAAARLNSLTQNLDLAGSLTLSGVTGTGSLRISPADVLHVLPGATLTSTGSNTVNHLSCCITPAKIVNDGTLAVNGGTFDVNGVELDQNATVAASQGGRLLSTIAPVRTGAAGNYTGDGSWAMQTGAIARLDGTQTLGSDFHLELGGLAVDGGVQLGGTATLAGTGTFDWSGGTVEGNLTIAHGVSVRVTGAHTGNGRRILAGQDNTAGGVPATLTNHGTITVDQGAAFSTSGTATLANASDGTVSFAPGTQLTSGSCCVSPDRITNAGKVIVPSGTSTAPVVITNIAYQASGGSASIASGRTLQLAGGAPNKLTSTTVSGAGTLAVAAPTAVSGTVTTGSGTRIVLGEHGSLNGTATLGGAGALTWTGGAISGDVTVTASAGVAISGPATKYLANIGGGSTPSKLTLAAPTSVAAGTTQAHDLIELGASALTLASTTSAAANAEFHGGVLLNTGALTVSPGSSGVVSKSGAGLLTNRGTVSVTSGSLIAGGGYRQTGGTTKLASGTSLTANGSGVSLSGGVLGGAGTVKGSVVSSAGRLAPGLSGIGTLRISGNYTQGSSARLLVDATTGGLHDLVSVTGAATLKGTLVTHNLSGYHPASGASRTVLTAGGGLHYGLSCAITSGTAATSGQWAPTHSSTRLSVVWRTGAHTHC